MTGTGTLSDDRRRFAGTVVVAAAVAVTFGLLLSSLVPQTTRQTVSAAGLVVAGVLATVAIVERARRSRSPLRRPWTLLAVAGVTVVLGNLWSSLTGADPTTSPSLVTDVCIAVGLVLSTLGLVSFPGVRRRGAELLVMFLDGLVAGGGLVVIVSKLVYSQLLDPAQHQVGGAQRALSLTFPVLDVMLATAALLMVLRAPVAQRLTLSLLATGFWLYAASDLTFAVRSAQGDFRFGSPLDLGWIYGYLALGLAAWVPARRARRQGAASDTGPTDAGATLVFSILVAATIVQVGFGESRTPHGAQAVVWVVLVAAAGARQILLTADNAALRRGLERRVEEQTRHLRRSIRDNEVLLESVADGIYGVDRDGTVTFLNPSAVSSLGYSLSELAGCRPGDVFQDPTPRRDGSPGSVYIDQAICAGVVATSTSDVYVRADGTTFPVEVTAAPLLEGREVRGAVVVFRDITQRREVERVKDEFVSVVSHELRTPLTSIRASLELLEGGLIGELTPRANSMIKVALESSERLTRLINNVLDVERIGSGAPAMDCVHVQARELLRTAAGQLEAVARESRITIIVGRATGAVLADRDQILQTLINLIGNAVKFSRPESMVRLEAHDHGAQVRFVVRDQGCGIPADKLEKVFERFVQVDSSDTRSVGGTGLGLAISRGIVERHGGEIWAESELGAGTTITFTLPSSITPSLFDLDPDAAEAATDLA